MAISPRQRRDLDPLAGEAEEGGQQRERRDHRHGTTTAAEMARPEMNETPMTIIPRKEMTTVSPAKVTARPAVSIAMAIASSDRVAVVEVLAVAGDDEQRVVDADAEADHHAEEDARSRASGRRSTGPWRASSRR